MICAHPCPSVCVLSFRMLLQGGVPCNRLTVNRLLTDSMHRARQRTFFQIQRCCGVKQCCSLNARLCIGKRNFRKSLDPSTYLQGSEPHTNRKQLIILGERISEMAPSVKMTAMPILEASVLRFDANEAARTSAWPSISFADPQQREVEYKGKDAGAPSKLLNIQCRTENGQQTVTIKLPSGTSFYGTGEVSGSLERTGKRIFTWNTDAWGYGGSTSALYQSHPWVLAVLPNGSALGVLADTTQRCEVDLRKEGSIKVVARAPYPVVTFGPHARAEDVLVSLAHATGRVDMPPKWALGYHQCRWSYSSAARVREVAQTFRQKKIPCDVMWMDIDYMHGFRCFTFDPETFADPGELSEALHAMGFKGVWMLDPGIKRDPDFSVYQSGTQRNVWVLKAGGEEPFVGDVWPRACVFPDFTMAAARSWWAALVEDFTRQHGVDGIWNDMNEPSVFYVTSKTMPESNVHRGDAELGGKRNHAHYHNVYGMLMARSTWEGMRAAQPLKRPFVLTRAAFMGSHRYAATWTGDNLASWEHLKYSVPMALNLAMSGQPFVGPDIGGFAGDATPQLFARWMGIGALLPFCRAHSETGTRDHEPWSFGPQCERVCRMALERRYRLLPHLYTLFYQSHSAGLPVIVPLFFADSEDPRLRRAQDSFLLGPLLVACCTDKIPTTPPTKMLLPTGAGTSWMMFDFDDAHPDLPVLYLRGGSIVPTGPVLESTQQAAAGDPITLLVALDDAGQASGILFEDDGDGYGYQGDDFLLTHYSATLEGGAVSVVVSKCQGNRRREHRLLRVIVLLGEGAQVEGEGVDGELVTIQMPDSKGHLIAEAKERMTRALTLAPEMAHNQVEGTGDTISEMQPEVVRLTSGSFSLSIVPLSGGRITSMLFAGHELLDTARPDVGGYEEYSGSEYRSAGCSGPYCVVPGSLSEDGVAMEGDVGGGLTLRRSIQVTGKSRVAIQSLIEATAVGAGSAGFSRIVCLRIHPSFKLDHPQSAYVQFTSIEGKQRRLYSSGAEMCLRGHERPNGEWALVLPTHVVTNTFDVRDVETCLLHWGGTFCNLELWSTERPVSKETPLSVSHCYDVSDV
eukprot:jgi/Mesen1/3728/ME000203S02822